MIAMATYSFRPTSARREFEILIIGDLRELLVDRPSRERDRWLLAILDMLLVSRPRLASSVYLPAIPRMDFVVEKEFDEEPQLPYEKLQRLRDRVAHRAPYSHLANELNEELQSFVEAII